MTESANDLPFQLYRGKMRNLDYLWFSSSEIDGISHTSPYLHNGALAYAIARRLNHFTLTGLTPLYVMDWLGEMSRLPAYPLPAIPPNTVKTVYMTISAIDDIKINNPDSSKKNYPNISQIGVLEPLAEGFYTTYLFVTDPTFSPPRLFYLSKMDTPMVCEWEKLGRFDFHWAEKPTRITHNLLNPRDIDGDIVAFRRIINIPPHSLIEGHIIIANEWVVKTADECLPVPNVIVSKINLSNFLPGGAVR